MSNWSSDVCSSDLHSGGNRFFVGKIALNGEERTVSGRGNGLISSVLAALRENCGIDLEVEDYSEHALGQGSDVQAAAYVECKTRSEEHTSELQSLMRISYAVFCLKKKKLKNRTSKEKS